MTLPAEDSQERLLMLRPSISIDHERIVPAGDYFQGLTLAEVYLSVCFDPLRKLFARYFLACIKLRRGHP